ncbi:hypothetical protein [Pseudalkalibacillus decolorationis]|uniref:hypothetical protein n=1 Tax=Pseudalkalibacillus decolorationis TaxID=163879 RepID=UPI0021472D37|nr:hypothetical protein [Pseudalkalibacillus decolorationis]
MKKWKYVTTVGLLLTITIGVSYYYYVINDQRHEQSEAVTAARKELKLTNIKDIEHYYGSYGSFQVIKASIGENKQYVFVPVKKGEPRTISVNEGWSKEKVKKYVSEELNPDELISIQLGLEKYTKSSTLTPVWEIVFEDGNQSYTFHYIRYADGTFFKEYSMTQAS